MGKAPAQYTPFLCQKRPAVNISELACGIMRAFKADRRDGGMVSHAQEVLITVLRSGDLGLGVLAEPESYPGRVAP